jgi:hypothetical protein
MHLGNVHLPLGFFCDSNILSFVSLYFTSSGQKPVACGRTKKTIRYNYLHAAHWRPSRADVELQYDNYRIWVRDLPASLG